MRALAWAIISCQKNSFGFQVANKAGQQLLMSFDFQPWEPETGNRKQIHH